ncbi:MAG: tetratricopeptide repeat protein [Planctomycetes bacterium]|nr:tetratricopeptide repeat protein [Planctomycetota bacterium]
MIRQSCFVIFPGLLLTLITSCWKASEKDPATIALPPIPEIDLSSFEPLVREQIEAAKGDLGRQPDHADANGKLAMLLHAYNWPEQALICYRRAALLNPADFRWWYYSGRVQAESGQDAQAIQSLERSTRCKADYSPALLLLGEIFLRMNNAEKALDWFEQAQKISPHSPHVWLGLGQVFLKKGDLDNAIQRFHKALELAPDFRQASYSLAMAYRQKGEEEKAALYFSRYSKSEGSYPPPDPLLEEIQTLRNDSDHVFRNANRLFKKGEYSEAIRFYREALKLNPDLALAEYNIALAWQTLNQPLEAISYYQRFLRRRPYYLDANNNLGLCFLQMSRNQEAIEPFKKALALDPGYYNGYFNLGLVFERTGDLGSAVENFQNAVKVRPSAVEAHFKLGRLLIRQGQAENAMAHFIEALKINPEDGDSQKELLEQFQLQQENQATSETAVRRQKGGLAYRKLSAFLKEQRLDAAAIYSLRKGIQEVREDWRTAVALAWILATCRNEKLRKPEEAVRLMEPICSSVASTDPVALDTLAVAYAASGRFEEACRTAETALRLANERQQRDFAERLSRRLSLFKDRRPFYEEP